jgi:tetratricopeptide (TPR) repeat protein
MFRILFWLHNLILFPYNLITAPFRASRNTFLESGRGRAMVLGLPAFIVAALGLSVLGWAEWGNKDNLEKRYNQLAEKTNENKTRLINELRTEQQLSAGKTGDAAENSGFDEKDPRIVELRDLQNAEEIYLEKLISLNPTEPDYRYRLAIVAGLMNDKQRCYSLMKSIAPDEEPGFAKAHLWMAENYMRQPTDSAAQRRQNLQLALQHSEHCLVRDSGNDQAKLMKAQLLTAERRLVEALKVYEELFAKYPRFYKAIVNLNKQLGQQSQNSIIYDQAQLRFQEAVDAAGKTYDESWPGAWNNLVICLRDRDRYELAVKKLVEEEAKQNRLVTAEGTPEAAARHIHIKQLLTQVYTDWASQIATQDLENKTTANEAKQLELLAKALELDPKYARAQQLVARISAGDSPLAEEARKIYNPEEHDDAPPEVLNEMGSRSLQNEKYDLAIKYFELARRKSPNDPNVLNNLAFTYLVCENKNPDRALQLVNQAIRQLSAVGDPNQQRMLASHFYDTRGRALMQMNRMDEAAAALEMAMQIRPDNEEILTALIKCYEGRDDLQAEVYRKQLEELKKSNGDSADQDAGSK